MDNNKYVVETDSDISGNPEFTNLTNYDLEVEKLDKKYEQYSRKNQIATILIWVIFGIGGGHYFYVGRIGKGILYLLTGGLFFIGALIDLFIIAGGKFKDKDGKFVNSSVWIKYNAELCEIQNKYKNMAGNV